MQNSSYTQKKIISASVKTLQINLLPCISIIALLRNKVSLPLNVPYYHQTIKHAVRTMVESLHTWLKTSLEISVHKLLFWYISKDSYINEPKRSLTQFTVKKRNQLVGLILD